MYAKCGALTRACQMLDELPVRDVVTWNALITGYVQLGLGNEALLFFDHMQCEGLSPDKVTFSCILSACGSIGAVDKGKQIHDEIDSQGLLGRDAAIGNALVNMYAKCGLIGLAQRVLNKLPVRNVVAWSALITGYVQHGHSEEALNCFSEMKKDGLSPDAVTFACILKACSNTRAVEKGEIIHKEIARRGLFGENIVLGTALVDMYGKCGAPSKAYQVLEELPVRNAVSWSALIAGCIQQGQDEIALFYYEQMWHESVSPDTVTFICLLKACGNIGAAGKGEKVHIEVACQGLVGKDILIGNALVDMYAKCGRLTKSQEVLHELSMHNVLSWTSLIAGCAQHGQIMEMLRYFEQLKYEGLSPDTIILARILTACSHCGLMDEGQWFFGNMRLKYGITPDMEHHTCMVDLFGRAGYFEKAITTIRKMPSADHLPVWSALLGTCFKWENVKLARLAFEHAVEIDKNDASAYVSMANIYLALGMQTEAESIEALRLKNRACIKPICG